MATFYQNVGRRNSRAAHQPEMTKAEADQQAEFFAVSERLRMLYPDHDELFALYMKMDAEWEREHPGQNCYLDRSEADAIAQTEAAIEARLNELDPLREFRVTIDEPADFDPARDTDLYTL